MYQEIPSTVVERPNGKFLSSPETKLPLTTHMGGTRGRLMQAEAWAELEKSMDLLFSVIVFSLNFSRFLHISPD